MQEKFIENIKFNYSIIIQEIEKMSEDQETSSIIEDAKECEEIDKLRKIALKMQPITYIYMTST